MILHEFQNFGNVTQVLLNFKEKTPTSKYICMAKYGMKFNNSPESKFVKKFYFGGQAKQDSPYMDISNFFTSVGSLDRDSYYNKINKLKTPETDDFISTDNKTNSSVDTDETPEEPIEDLMEKVSNYSSGSVRRPASTASTGNSAIDKSVEYIKNNATSKYTNGVNGYCGRAVHNALKEGGFNVGSGHGYMFHENGLLTKGGFKEVYTGNGADESKWGDTYKPQAGDVVVFDRSDGHNYGHVAMYTGNDGWYSDFKQGSFHGYKDPSKVTSYHIYRKA